MTSKLDTARENGTGSSKLPVLREGRSSLVSLGQGHASPSLKERASEWAIEVRAQIGSSVDKHEEVREDSIHQLKNELVAVFITALQQDTRTAWIFLHEVLGLAEPYSEYLAEFDLQAELNHYIERLVHHVDIHKERLFDLQIMEALQKVFPTEMSRILQTGAMPGKSYSSPVPPLPSKEPLSPRKSSKLLLPDGSDPYRKQLPNPNEQVIIGRPLMLNDLRMSIGNVALEMAGRDAIWNRCMGTTALALNIELPEEMLPAPVVKATSQESHQSAPEKITSPREKVITSRTPREEEPPVPMTGREAVEYFAKCHHTGRIKSLFFNVTENRHYHPYDLISVAKNKTDKEHYVFSTFGLLHVYPDGSAENQTLAEWQREAVLWGAVSKILFFKNYLMMKTFRRWRANKLHLDFLRRRGELSVTLLTAVPPFASALLQISKLLKELLTVQFLPFETDKTYGLCEFENNINYKNIQAERLLEKFFSYCKLVVDVTAEESFRKLHYCEEQVRKKNMVSKDSLHRQRMKKEQREENLKKARSETGRLGNFVKLVDQLVIENMFHIAKTQATQFIQNVLNQTEDAQREGFFRANLVFTKQEVLGLSPSKDRYLRVLSGTLRGIPTVLCANAIPLDGCVSDHEEVDEESSIHGKRLSSVTQPDVRKSTTAGSLLSSVHKLDTQAAETVSDVPLKSRGGQENSSDDSFPVPDLPKPESPSKERDDLGVATPDLVLPTLDEEVKVIGEGIMGQYTPLFKASLEEKLNKDHQFQQSLRQHSELMTTAIVEIDQYCDENKWLIEIHQYCKRWTEKSVRECRGVAAYTIEQKLNEIRQWAERVRSFDQSFMTMNGLFYVDCSAIHNVLLPRLNDIYIELVTFVADEAKALAKSFCDEMKNVIQNMKDKRSTVEAFAVFAKNYTQYKRNTPQYQQRVEYIKSLYEVIRMSYRQLTPEEDRYEESVWAAWESFLLQMQDAAEFVNTQTPLMTQQLEDTYQRLAHAKTNKQRQEALENPSKVMKLEREAYQLCELLTSGKFLNPDENPTRVLIEMRKIREKFQGIQNQLQQASKWRDAICGSPYDLTFLNEMITKMDARQDLWKYFQVSTDSIKEWKQSLFRRLNARKAMEKVREWETAAAQMAAHLPDGDLVLDRWSQELRDFKRSLPILHKLSNDALKDRHWKAIFMGMNEAFDPTKEFTVAEMLTYDLEEHADLINYIYLGAIAEYDLELRIVKIKKLWEEREFKLAKHIPDSVVKSKVPAKKPGTAGKRRTKLQKFRQEKKASSYIGLQHGLDVANDDFFILIEVEELKYQLEDSRISIQTMLDSPYLGDMKQEVRTWSSSLEEAEEITDLWTTCQKKWLYLLKIFERPDMYKKLGDYSLKFEAIHNKFKDWMRVVAVDAKVMSVVNRRRGDKGYRLLQGEHLRNQFLSSIETQEEILKFLEQLLEASRSQFPRLHFISNDDMVNMLGISRNPRALLPYVQKCFPGVTSLTFDLPLGMPSIGSALEFVVNADKLEVTCLHGGLGEKVPLYGRLAAHPEAATWLLHLERRIKNSMTLILQACVQGRLEDGSKQPIHLLEELAQVKHTQSHQRHQVIATEIKHTFRHWLLRFPAECVLTAEAIMWERTVFRSFERQSKDELHNILVSLKSKLGQYVDILHEETNGQLPPETKDRLYTILGNLVNQSVHYRDVLTNLTENGCHTEKSFDWLRVLKYHMDIHNVLRAKTAMYAMGTIHTDVFTNRSMPIRAESAQDDSRRSYDAHTTISSDYQFSPCSVYQMNNSFAYDYEYNGPVDRLVMTPLTERAYLSLSQSVKNFQCGTLIGPSGTGKSETIRDLAKAFGRCLFTVTCSEAVTLPTMVQYLSGMTQSGCWVLFDDTDRLTTGLMSVVGQQMDYLRTALRTLELTSENQYKIRGQPRYDKREPMKLGSGDKVIRRNSLTTLHPLPRADSTPPLERQKTVPHGFNEKGLVTYFEDTWVAERDKRRHSIDREIEIKESELYKANRPPPLFYEHVMASRRKSVPDYSKLLQETTYVHRYLGNVMFSSKLMQASANSACFMTLNTSNAACEKIPDNFRLLMRPCALIVPDYRSISEMKLWCCGFQDYKLWCGKLEHFFTALRTQLPRHLIYSCELRCLNSILALAKTNYSDRSKSEDTAMSDKGSTRSSLDFESDTSEEMCLVNAIRDVILPRMLDESDVKCFVNCLRDVFPRTTRPTSGVDKTESPLEDAIREELRENNLKQTPELVEKILQLHGCLLQKRGVILSGPPGSGKTTVYQSLARTLNMLNYRLFRPDHSRDDIDSHTDTDLQSPRKSQEAADRSPRHLVGVGRPLPSAQDVASDKGASTSNLVADYPKVNIQRVNPSALTPQELFGSFNGGLWEGGILSKILHNASAMSEATNAFIKMYKEKTKKSQLELPSTLLQWIVLDGCLHESWTDNLNTLLDDGKMLCLANGDTVPLQDSMDVIFETTDLSRASPSLLTRCSVVHCGVTTVPWQALVDSWVKVAKVRWVITTAGLKVINNLVRDVFPPALKFLASDCSPALLTDVGMETSEANMVAPGILEVTSFLKLLGALMDKIFLREEYEKNVNRERHAASSPPPAGSPSCQATSRMTSSSQVEQHLPHYMEIIKGMFAFSFIWGFGGHIHERQQDLFSQFTHEVLFCAAHPIRLPQTDTVYDYCLDEMTGTFVKWSDRTPDRVRSAASTFVATPEVDRYCYLIDLMLNADQPVLLTGLPGVGKSALVQHVVQAKHPFTPIRASPYLTMSSLKETIMSHVAEMKNRAQTNIGGSSSPMKAKSKHLFFIDDLNTAPSEHDSQPAVELLRQLLSHRGFFDKQRQLFHSMTEANILAACTVPTVPGSGLGHSCHIMSSRLTRLFFNLSIFTPAPESLMSMHSRALLGWLEYFPAYTVEHHFELGKAMLHGMFQLYDLVQEKFRPTPSHAHYLFSLHDIGRVIQGILMMSPRSKVKKTTRIFDKEDEKGRSSTRTSVDQPQSRSQSIGSLGGKHEPGFAAPMMRVIGRLWCHECTRTFSDRLIDQEDQAWFTKVLEEIAVKQFCCPRDDPIVMSAICEETQSQIQDRATTAASLTTDEFEADAENRGSLTADSAAHRTISPPYPIPSPASTLSPESCRADPETVVESSTINGEAGLTIPINVIESTPLSERPETGISSPMSPGRPEGSEVESSQESNMDTSDVETGSDVTRNKKKKVKRKHRQSFRPASNATAQDEASPLQDTTKASTVTTAILTSASSDPDGVQNRDTGPAGSGWSSQGSNSVSVGGKTTGTPRWQGSRTSGMRRGVTFKSSLMADGRDHEEYYGALMSVEELKGSWDSLADIIFTKFYLATHSEAHGLTLDKASTYTETPDWLLAESLKSCLAAYNNATSQRLELVFFNEAACHVARLSRVLALQGGHAVLLGMSYCTGRATFVRLASYVAHCKLFEPKVQSNTKHNYSIVQEHIKRCCHHAGILGKPTTLMVHEELGEACLQDICCLMQEGTVPGLYSTQELQHIVTQMMPGGVQTKQLDKVEQAMKRFHRKVKQNLHVIVCLNYRGNSFSSDFDCLNSTFSHYPALLKLSCCIDVYRPWTQEAVMGITEKWLLEETSKVPLPWDTPTSIMNVPLTSTAMAYMHMSAKLAVERQFCHQRAPLRFFTPLTLQEFVHLFKVIAAYIVKKEKDKISQFEATLGKLFEAFGSITEYKREVSNLFPKLLAARQTIEELVETVETHRQQYIQALEKCKEQEEMITQMQGPLEKLRKETQSEFDKVNPAYQAALEALNSLYKSALDELKSYREPHQSVQWVVNALCVLFEKQQNWENGKLLLMRDNFVQDLVFYDKDNIPDAIFKNLKVFVNDVRFNPDVVRMVSLAASCIAQWVHAVYKYAEIYRTMKPRLKSLIEAEEKFNKAQSKLGEMRLHASRSKSALEKQIESHKKAMKYAKGIEKQIQTIEKKIARASELMGNMSHQHMLWKKQLKNSRNRIKTSAGDALVTAASVCYFGPLEDKYRNDLLQDWIEKCQHGDFFPRFKFGSIDAMLNDKLKTLIDVSGDFELSNPRSRDSQKRKDASNNGPIPIKTFSYHPTMFDAGANIKSKMKMADGDEDVTPADLVDSEPDDDQSPLLTRPGFTLQDVLSDFRELSDWRIKDLPSDLHSLQNAFIIRVSCHNRKYCWPLLIDPDNQAELWVRALHESKNIFCERDVVTGGQDGLPDGVPLDVSAGSHVSGQLGVPSRSLAPTSPAFVPNDDIPSESRAFTRQSFERSRETAESDDTHAITSITNSWETSNVQADDVIERPENNLWIVEADSTELNAKLINAIVHGVTLLITHLERQPLGPLFRSVLMKQFYVDKDGRRVMNVRNQVFPCDSKFRLYLSTSLPLFTKGDGVLNIPVHRMYPISLALSDEAVVHILLKEVMNIERKEFEGQKRANENDLIRHRQELTMEQDIIREKTMNLDGPLLDDKTMLDSLISCKLNLEKNLQILEQTNFMGDHLEEKRVHYIPMAVQAAMLFTVIKKLQILHPCYYMPFYKFVDIFAAVLKSRDRGKGSSGAPQARAQELSDATSTAIFRHVSMMMFRQHFILFSVLVAMEKLRVTTMVTDYDMGLFINGFDRKSLDEEEALVNKPDWIENEMWCDCIALEMVLKAFSGLQESFTANPVQWEEYFKHPITLMNPVPGSTLQKLSIFHKCLLWKTCYPNRMSEISEALIQCELGNVTSRPNQYSIQEIYRDMETSTPVVFLLPSGGRNPPQNATEGFLFIDPVHEVKRLAKEIGMEGRVKVMNFGLPGSLCEVIHTMEDCMQNGYWFILQNLHLAGPLTLDMHKLLKTIVYSKWRDENESEITNPASPTLVTRSPFDLQSHVDTRICDSFRLWITTSGDVGNLIPGVLVQHGLKVTCEVRGHFRGTLQKSYKSAAFLLSKWWPADDDTVSKTTYTMLLALIHSLLVQQRYYGNRAIANTCHWSLFDLAASVELFRKGFVQTEALPEVMEKISSIYEGHCTNPEDAGYISALIRRISQGVFEKDEVQLTGVSALLGRIMAGGGEPFSLRLALDALEETSARIYGLPDQTEAALYRNQSRIISHDLVRVVGAPELILHTAAEKLDQSLETRVTGLLSILDGIAELPSTNKNQFYPLDSFLHEEVNLFKDILFKIDNDLNLLLQSESGNSSVSLDLRELASAISMDRVPIAWLMQTFPSCNNINQWLRELGIRVEQLTSYCRTDVKPATYNLSVFMRPDRFIQAVKQTYARQHFKDVTTIKLEPQILPTRLMPSSPPTVGVYVTGLQLCNASWDTTRSALMSSSDQSRPFDLLVVHIRPVETKTSNKRTIKYQLYECPVYGHPSEADLSTRNIITRLELPSLCEPMQWTQRKVFIASSLPDH